MIVAGRFVRDRRRSLLWWGIGVLGLVLVTVSFYPSIRNEQSFEDLYADLPDALKAMMGTFGDISITSTAGYLQGRLYGSLLPLMFLIFGIGAGARAIAGSEEDGTLELLLANPISRSRVLFQRYLAVVLLVAALGAVALAGMLVLSPPFDAIDGLSVLHVAGATAAAAMLALAFASVAFAIGAATGRRGPALGVATTLAVATYLIQGMFSISESLQSFAGVSPWHWYLGENLLLDGPSWAAFVLPGAVVAVCVAVAWWRFNRRDLR